MMTFALTGCSKTRFVSVRYLPEKSLEFFVPLCGDELLRALELKEVDDPQDPSRDRLLWRVQAIGDGASLARLEFGSEPTGFRSEGVAALAEMTEGYSTRMLAVSATTDRGSLIASFTIDELPTDGSAVLQGTPDRVVSVTELDKAQRDACSPSTADEIATMASRVAIAGFAVGGVAWLVIRRRRRRPAAT